MSDDARAQRLREALPRLAFDHPVTMGMAFLALLLISVIAAVRVPVQMMPDGFDPKFLYIWMPYPNASPLETDEQVVRPVIEQLGTVSGIKSLESEAESGSASFHLRFHSSVDMDEAYNAVVDRLERAMVDMPDEVERYGIYRFDPNDEPVVWAGVSLPETIDNQDGFMERIVRPRLERVPGVASLDIWGTTKRLVYVDWDRERLMEHGVDLGDVLQRLRSDNFQLPGGRIEAQGLIRHVRSLARLDHPDQLKRYPIGNGRVLSDVADVEVRTAASASINRIGGKEAAGIGISRESSANTVEVAAAVREAFADLEADPRSEGAKFFVFFDQGELIQDSMDTLRNSALQGGFFAVIVLFVFLRDWRMTALIAASIPFSLLMTVTILYFRGDSLNLLALMGLMLAVGMVVDNAIVVIETIVQRRAAGASTREAAIGGTGEVNLAILLSTSTTMVVFLPIILMSEDANFSFFMGTLGFPVVFALAASLVVALLFAPLATRFIGSSGIKPDPRWLAWLIGRYVRSLGWMLRHKFDAGALLVGMLVLTVIVPMRGVECSNEADENLNDFTIRFSVPPQADYYERDAIVKRFEGLLEDNREAWGVRVYRVRLHESDTVGRLNVNLLADGPMPREEVMEAAKAALPDDIPGVRGWIGWDSGRGESRSIDVMLHGEDVAVLEGLAKEVARRVETVDGVLGAELPFDQGGADEMRVLLDPDAAARYGLTAQRVGQTLSFAMRGAELEPIRSGNSELDVVTRFELEDRVSLDKLLDFPMWSPVTRRQVPLRAVTDVEIGKGPGTIRREDRRTAVSVRVDLEEEVSADDAWPQLEGALGDMALPEGYTWDRGNDRQMEMEEDRARDLALLLSITFVFLLMGMLFESFLLPLAIITTVPMALMGAWWALWLTGTPMDVMAGVGLIILIGVVVNNGIVLVDLVTQLRREGMDRTEALLTAGRRRMRPILMTAMTTIIGVVPMATGDSGFVGIPYAPLGRTVIGGMTAATLLTLLYVPYLYALLDDFRAWAFRFGGIVRAWVTT